MAGTTAEDQRALDNFREYLRIESVHPKPDYDGCVSFLKKKAEQIHLKAQVVSLDEFNPVLILTLPGESPELPAILLNSHMDVVPVFKEKWDHDPFAADMDEKGDIIARGAQDMKSVTIAQLEAIRRLKQAGKKLKRTVHMTILPDEELGSKKGMSKFVKTKAFQNLNIGFDIDEGMPAEDGEMILLNDEKCSWHIHIHCPGTSGHGSIIHPNTAGEKLRIVIDKFMEFREKEAAKLATPEITLTHGEICTINLTQLKGGVQNNVVPPEFEVGFDVRLTPDKDHDQIVSWVQEVCEAAGEGVYAEYQQKEPKAPITCDDNNPFLSKLKSTLKEMNQEYKTYVSFGASDARFVRNCGIPAVGLSPFLNTKPLLHSHNEYMNSKEFLRGLICYEKIIEALANV